ncbi:hypothetical protein BJ138DRAFT_1013764 [Hygrophoropsis aurantiaca]|uniref:Uncharacterized protein n=1 Tax=Hygrophoropsis aurantiaca TaxID=72124 RepID=A0ACB8A5I8_9AGAM|nr:hypothetical protein BJ138DRAFT_1013764 [Hygrophoropsis aurantiaca]
MPRLLVDPALEEQPDHSSAMYQGLRTAIIGNTQTTEEEAAERLTELWRTARDDRTVRWQAQLEEDARIAAEAEQERQAQEAQEREQREQAAELERQEAEKKKLKINDFDDNRQVDSSLVPHPSAYAMSKLEHFEYVELWYFTQAGCAEAAIEAKSTSDDAYGLTKVDGFAAFRRVSDLKASRKVVQDHLLSWRDFDIGKTNLLYHIDKLKWPKKHQDALMVFFLTIVNHEYRVRPRGEEALVIYASRVRYNWHEFLKRNQGYNISLFNNELFQTIVSEVWDIARDQGLQGQSFQKSYNQSRS